jgi:hypothetical protein
MDQRSRDPLKMTKAADILDSSLQSIDAAVEDAMVEEAMEMDQLRAHMAAMQQQHDREVRPLS